jgi:hypothetical protein
MIGTPFQRGKEKEQYYKYQRKGEQDVHPQRPACDKSEHAIVLV